ncbi:MAG TPA: dihydroorotate dehydrogenase electron transfer subunit [Firmicutes bacterium]|nr:dihydroorotate dehydrogenase electron transfer subunit [Candidatus Fermentithermobacillaceae bacterium]
MSTPEIHDVLAEVMSVKRCRGGVYRAELVAPEIAAAAKPFQFVNIKVSPGNDPFLRRPFSLSRIEPDEGIIEITWAVVGKGTGIMATWEPGRKVKILGPLGNGFSLEDKGLTGGFIAPLGGKAPELILVAGGTGLAPMYPLVMSARKSGFTVSLFYGGRSLESLMDTDRFEQSGCEVHISTEDGSAGFRGVVTGLFESHLRNLSASDIVVACGPRPMLQRLKSMCGQRNIRLYVSLEERMACGVGLCKGCAVKTSGNDPGYRHVCTDGPVFLADTVELGGE